ncbi:MAG: peptide deformylase [Candidatus Hydrothermota bacterium]|nr:MAG: peptide deformylase [Candidatus Hydrothermae bacterium]
MVLPIKIIGEPILKTPCEKVEDVDGKVVKFAGDLVETMYAHKGIGLAAPQVGKKLQIISVDTVYLELGSKPQVLINPQVVYAEGEVTMEEGCLSIPGLYWDVVRPEKIVVKALELLPNGKLREVEIEADGLYARVLLHEIDHLHGVLFVDRLPAREKTIALAKWRRMRRASAS